MVDYYKIFESENVGRKMSDRKIALGKCLLTVVDIVIKNKESQGRYSKVRPHGKIIVFSGRGKTMNSQSQATYL